MVSWTQKKEEKGSVVIVCHDVMVIVFGDGGELQ